MSSRERFQKVQELFHAAAGLPSNERPDFVRAQCSGDESLRAEVEALLQEDEAGEGLLTTAVQRDDGRSFAFGEGVRIAEFEIIAPIGAGGMGHVYRARDTKLGRDVALKVLPRAFAGDPERISRFQREATILAAVNHPGIAAIHGLAEVDGRIALVMELVEGPTLAERISTGPIAAAEVLALARKIGEALEAAHERGIIHRDLKPANIKITPNREIKILDFGLAKLQRPDSMQADAVNGPASTQLATEIGVILGTPSYMAPEQARGATVDKRADIWAFGVVLYEMLTGRRLFAGATNSDTIAAVLTKEPDLGDVPIEFRRLLRRCLQKDPKLRLRDVMDAWDLIDSEPPVSSRRSKLLWLAAFGGTALVAMAGLSLIPTIGPVSDGRPLHAAPLTADPGEEQHPSFSPDGSQIVYAATDSLGDDSDLFIIAPGTGATLHLVSGPTFDTVPRWSPDGKWIAFWRRGAGICLTSPLGGQVRRIGGYNAVYDMAWTPDSKRLVVATYGAPLETTMALKLVDIETGAAKELLPAQRGLSQQVPNVLSSSIAISSDGRTIVRTERVQVPNTHHVLAVYRFDGSAVTKVNTIRGQLPFFVGVSFFPDNRHLLAGMGSNFANVRLFRVGVDSGKIGPVAVDITQALWPVLSRQGNKLVFTRQNYDENLYSLPLKSPGVPAGTPSPFATSTARDSNPNISPDGTRVAFGSYRTGAPEIFISDAQARDVQRLTTMNAAVAGSPRFSPDGKWLAFDSRTLSGEADIFVMPVDGGPIKRLTSHPAADTVPTWSRDGAYIYFHSNRSGSSQVWKMKSDGTDPVQITHGGGYIAFEAVDARSIYYSKNDNVNTELWVTGVNGGGETLVVNTLYRHNFSPTAKGIYLSTSNGLHGGPEIIYFRFADHTLSTVYRLNRPVGLGLTVAPDESWLLFSQLDGSGNDLMVVEDFH